MSFWHKNNAGFSVFRVDSKDYVLDWFTALGQVSSCWKSKPMLITNANALSAMGHSICQSWVQSLLVHKWVVCMEGFGSVYNALFPGQLHHILCIVMHKHRIWLWLNYISPLNIHSSNKSNTYLSPCCYEIEQKVLSSPKVGKLFLLYSTACSEKFITISKSE